MAISATDLRDAARGNHMLFESVSPGFVVNRLADARGDRFVVGPAAHERAQVHLRVAQQAEAQYALGGQAHAGAIGAEGFENRANETDAAGGTRDAVEPRLAVKPAVVDELERAVGFGQHGAEPGLADHAL